MNITSEKLEAVLLDTLSTGERVWEVYRLSRFPYANQIRLGHINTGGGRKTWITVEGGCSPETLSDLAQIAYKAEMAP